MNLRFHAEAAQEYIAAVAYYNSRADGLGAEFVLAVEAAIAKAMAHPTAWTAMSANTRRCLLERFPYGVIYEIDDGTLYVVAVMPLKRRPDYWQEREKGR